MAQDRKLAITIAATILCGVMADNAQQISENVRDQYENFPYPQLGEPSEENTCETNEFLKVSMQQTDWLQTINHHTYDGAMPNREGGDVGVPLRVLIAGGGTGRDSILFARELIKLNLTGSITHLDFSGAAVQLAERWANACGVWDRISFSTASIEQFAADHAAFGIPGYHVIMCSGVLHHLPDPSAGLVQLGSMLKDQGVLKLMVYSKYGRAGLREAQEALRYALPPNEDLSASQRLTEVQRFIGSPGMPPEMTLQKNKNMAVRVDLDSSEMFDRLLHAQEHSYSVIELDELVRSGGFEISVLHPEAVYEPDHRVFTTTESQDSYMAHRIRKRSWLERFHFTELMTNSPIHHYAILTKQGKVPKASYNQRKERRLDRRTSAGWRSGTSIHLLNPYAFRFHPTTLQQLKAAIIAHQELDVFVDIEHTGKRTKTKLRIPLLSFVFMEKLNGRVITAHQAIKESWAATQEWGATLTVQEVAKAFFEWLELMEDTDTAVCEKLLLGRPAKIENQEL